MPLILDLCGGTGAWSAPYRRAGYEVVIVDPLVNYTVEEWFDRVKSGPGLAASVHGILAAPPCTEFSSAGARHWRNKDPHLLRDAVRIVRTCIDIVCFFSPNWWALENPVGRIQKACPFLGAPVARFHPWHFGDPWTKQTWLWGNFKMPLPTHNSPPTRERINAMSDSKGRAMLRSITPPGFANAFFGVNP